MIAKAIKPIILCSIFMTMIFCSCEESANDQMNNNSELASIQFALIDAPDDYEAVLIDVQGLKYKLASAEADSVDEGESDSTSWETVEITPQVYDLLALNNGDEAILADVDAEEGVLKEVRLILGGENHLVIEGDSVKLKVPSGSQSGLKIKINEPVESGEDYKLVMDFDVAKSIVKAGKSGKYILKPVIKASFVQEEEEPGAITGVVSPDSVSSTVYVIDEDQDSVSTIPEENGSFLVSMLEAGSYEVVAVPNPESGLSEDNIEGVVVSEGMTTQLDTLKFE